MPPSVSKLPRDRQLGTQWLLVELDLIAVFWQETLFFTSLQACKHARAAMKNFSRAEKCESVSR
jgi:hypothetical protein